MFDKLSHLRNWLPIKFEGAYSITTLERVSRKTFFSIQIGLRKLNQISANTIADMNLKEQMNFLVLIDDESNCNYADSIMENQWRRRRSNFYSTWADSGRYWLLFADVVEINLFLQIEAGQERKKEIFHWIQENIFEFQLACLCFWSVSSFKRVSP